MVRSRSLPPSGHARSVVDRTYQQLVDAIAMGRYAAGEHLSEARLTAELDVSRGSLREAIGRLCADGVLDIIPHRGAVVRKVTHEEVAEFFELRGLYEGLAARRATKRLEEPDHRRKIAVLTQEVEDLIQSSDGARFAAHNRRFHDALMDMSGGSLLRRNWERLRNGRQRLKHLQNFSEDYIRQSLQEHKAILSAILDGDAALAEKLSAAHVEIGKNRIQRLPLQEFDALLNSARGQAAPVSRKPVLHDISSV